MADPLAEALNRISANPQSAEIAPRPASQARDGLVNPMPRWQRVLGTTLPEMGATIASAPFALYSLADAGSRWAFNTPLPGGEGAREISDSITQPVRTMSNRLAGEPLQDNLLSGDPLQVGAAWLRLGLTAGASAPVAAAARIEQAGRMVRAGANKLTAGNVVVDKLTAGLGRALEVLTPITITSKPSPKIAALNVGVASAIGTGVELAIGPQIAEAKQDADEAAKGALDVAAQGAEEVQRGQQAVVKAGLPSTGSTMGDVALYGLAGVAVAAGIRRDITMKVVNGITKSATGYDPRIATEATNTPLSTRLKQQFVDSDASLGRTERVMQRSLGKTRKEAWDAHDRVNEELSYRSGPSVDTRKQEFIRFGTIPDSIIKTVAPNDIHIRYNALQPQQQADAAERLVLIQERDARATLLRDKFNGRTGPIGSPQAEQALLAAEQGGTSPRHHLFDMSTRDLNKRIAQLSADQAVVASNDEFLSLTRTLPRYMAEQRFRTRAEAQKMLQENPNYVPTRLAPGNKYMNRVDQELNNGLRTIGEIENPYAHLNNYIDEVFRGVEGEKARRAVLQPWINAADNGNAFARSLFGRRNMPEGAQSSDLFVHYRDAKGIARNIEVNDAVVRNALQNISNPSQLQMVNGVLNSFARIYESGSVGTLSVVTGSAPFAPISAGYATTMGAAIRKPGIAAGPLDRVIQDITKGPGLPGDPTMIPHVAFKMLQNVGAVFVDRAARSMHHSILTDGFLTKYMGPIAKQHYADAITNKFKESNIYKAQQDGILGPASIGAVDPSREFIHAKAKLQQHGVATHVGSFVGDILHAISSAPTASLKALNKNVDPVLLRDSMRNFAGDPGRSGAFKGSQKAAEVVSATPFMNVSIQSIARFGEALRRNPATVAMGITNMIVLPSMGSTIYNAMLGPEYADYQFNKRTPDKLAASLYFGIPGLLPEQGIELPFIDPTTRVFKYMGELLAGSQLGIMDGSIYKDENSSFKNTIAAATTHRMFSFGEGGVPRKLLEQSVLPGMIPVGGALLASKGISPRGYLDTRPITEARNKGYTEGEGRNPQATFLDNYMPASVEEVFKALGSQAAANVWNTLVDTESRMKAGAKFPEATKQSMKNATMLRYSDKATAVGGGELFGSFLAIAPSVEASGSLVREKLNGIKKFSEAFASGTAEKQAFVGTAKRGLQVREGQGPAAGSMEMQRIGEQAKVMYQELSENYLGRIKDAYEQRTGLQNDPRLSPEMKRAKMNKYSEEIIQLNRAALQDVLRYEAIVSGMFGREIKFDKLKLSE